jgi:hypothetical protein
MQSCRRVVEVPKPAGDDSRFQLQLTRKGRVMYQDLQSRFAERVKRALVASGTTEKELRPVYKQVAVLSLRLSGVREEAAAPVDDEGNAMIQHPLAW